MSLIIKKWTQQEEELLQTWKQHTSLYEKKHSQASLYFDKWDKCLGIPVIIISAIIGTSAFSIAISNVGQDGERISLYIISIITMIVTVLSALQHQMKFDKKAQNHWRFSIEYCIISQEISSQLAIPNCEREEGRMYINMIQSTLEGLYRSCPPLPRFLLQQFHKEMKTISSETDSDTKDELSVPISIPSNAENLQAEFQQRIRQKRFDAQSRVIEYQMDRMKESDKNMPHIV